MVVVVSPVRVLVVVVVCCSASGRGETGTSVLQSSRVGLSIAARLLQAFLEGPALISNAIHYPNGGIAQRCTKTRVPQP